MPTNNCMKKITHRLGDDVFVSVCGLFSVCGAEGLKLGLDSALLDTLERLEDKLRGLLDLVDEKLLLGRLSALRESQDRERDARLFEGLDEPLAEIVRTEGLS